MVHRRDHERHVLGGEVLLLVELDLLGRGQVTAQRREEPGGIRGLDLRRVGAGIAAVRSPPDPLTQSQQAAATEWMSSSR